MNGHIKNMAEILKALGDEKRLKIIKIFASNNNEIFCVSDVAKQLGISNPLHLSI